MERPRTAGTRGRLAGEQLAFSFDGRTLRAAPGSTLAAALLANGIRSWRTTRVAGQPRGVLCGIGTCFDCLVDVGELRSVRACVTLLCDGDELRSSSSLGAAEPAPGQAGDR